MKSAVSKAPEKEKVETHEFVLDKKDLEILKLLQSNARITIKEISENVHLSTTPVHERIKRMEEDGVISQSADYNKMNKLHHKSVGLKITEDRIRLFNQETESNGNIKISDLHDTENNPAGTKVEIKIKAV